VAMPDDDGAHPGEETTRAEWKAIRDDNVMDTFDWEWNSTLPVGYPGNIDANNLFFDDPANVSGGSIPTFQVSIDHSLTHGLHNQNRLTEPEIELSGPGSINPSDQQAQDSPWAMNSLAPQSAEYAPSNIGTSVHSHGML